MCLHINYILDFHEGTEICTDCGLVLNPLFIQPSEKTIPTQSVEVIPTQLIPTQIVSIEESLERLNVPTSFSKLCKTFLCKYTKLGLKKNAHLLSVVVYKVLVQEKIPRTMREIAYVFNTTTCKMWKLLTTIQEKEGAKKTENLKAVDILFKYCQMLNIAFDNYKKIANDVEKYSTIFPQLNPCSIIGGVIYNFQKSNKKKISLKKVSEIVNVSSMSIQRFLKRKKVHILRKSNVV